MKRHFAVDGGWHSRQCPACENPENTPLFSKEGVLFVECPQCGTAYVNPQPPDSLLNDIYAEYGTSYFTNETKLEVDFRPDRFRREQRVLPKSGNGKSLLDVGCSTGSFLKIARDLGFTRTCGIDVAAASVEWANSNVRGIEAVAGNFLEQPFRENEFDIVTLWATLEHVPDPAGFIRESLRVLKPGGELYVSVPSRNSLYFRVLGRKWQLVCIEHLTYFTPASLAHLMKTCGFLISRTATYGFNPFVFKADLLSGSAAEQPDTETKISDSQRNANVRRNPVVAACESALDSVLNPLSLGELLILSARKP